MNAEAAEPRPSDAPVPDGDLAPRTRRILLAVVLLGAVALRLAGLFHDLQFSYHGDELHFIKRSMALGTGDLNPHWFHKPTFLMYVLLFFYGVMYLVGSLLGRFESAEAFGAWFLADQTAFVLVGRLVVAAFGIATVYVVYRIARRRLGDRMGLMAAGVAAVLFPMVASSQGVKADVPAAFFVSLSFLFFLRSREERGWKPLVLASLFAGVSMGTKYYGILLLPLYGIVELWAWLRRRQAFRQTLARGSVVVVLFVGGFFAASPYNFLDPTWASQQFPWVMKSLGLAESSEVYRPDNDTVYKPGASALITSTPHFAQRFVHPRAFGVLTVLIAAGLAFGLARRRTRPLAGYVLMAFGGFWFLSCTLNAFHINWRHFNAIAPLLCVLVPLGAGGLAGTVRLRGAVPVLAILGVACLPTLWQVAGSTAEDLRPDSRTSAYAWVLENLPADARLLVDEQGPIFQPSAPAIARLRERLAKLPKGEAFTEHQSTRLDLLERYPPGDARDIEELAHPWWMNREIEDPAGDWQNRDMGNPLKARVAKSLEAYYADGIRYVITNSYAQQRYGGTEGAEAFPSFAALYKALAALEPLHVVDPAQFGGKGPVVTIYELKKAP